MPERLVRPSQPDNVFAASSVGRMQETVHNIDGVEIVSEAVIMSQPRTNDAFIPIQEQHLWNETISEKQTLFDKVINYLASRGGNL